jgi:hypothetical protein
MSSVWIEGRGNQLDCNLERLLFREGARRRGFVEEPTRPNAVGVLLAEAIVAAAIELIAGLKASAGTDKEKDAIAACEDQAERDVDKCDPAAEKLIFSKSCRGGCVLWRPYVCSCGLPSRISVVGDA